MAAKKKSVKKATARKAPARKSVDCKEIGKEWVAIAAPFDIAQPPLNVEYKRLNCERRWSEACTKNIEKMHAISARKERAVAPLIAKAGSCFKYDTLSREFYPEREVIREIQKKATARGRR